MKFAASQWLWLLLMIPIGYLIAFLSDRARQQRLSSFIHRSLWSALIPELDLGARLRKARFWWGAALFAVIALARPQWGIHQEVTHVAGLDILVVLDISNSMDVEDVLPSRLNKAKHLVHKFVDGLHGDRMGVVPFAATSYVACPLTTDLEYALETIDVLTPRAIVNQGTDIGRGLEIALGSLSRGAEEGAPVGSEKVASQAILLISDGEDHEEQAIELAKKARSAGINLFVIGVGTEKGGPIPIRDSTGNLHGYKRDPNGQGVVSTFKPSALMEIASAGGGRYWNASLSESEVDEIHRELGGLNRTDYAERRQITHEERYQWPLAIALLFFLLELTLPLRKTSLSISRTSVGMVAVLFLGTQMGCIGSADHYQENEKGIQAFNEGRLDEAKQHFSSVQAKNPSAPELFYNQALVQEKEGDVDGAIRSFSEAAKGVKKDQPSELDGRAFFNLGATYAKKGDLPNAVQSYLGAIEAAQRNHDTALEQDTRKNLELLVTQLEQQQKEEQQQQQEEKDGENEEKEKKEDNGQKKKKSGPTKNYKDLSRQPRKFQSQKLTNDAAERVMAELKSRERDLQGRSRKQGPKPEGNSRDW